jgi:hypothetical protein
MARICLDELPDQKTEQAKPNGDGVKLSEQERIDKLALVPTNCSSCSAKIGTTLNRTKSKYIILE